jgi:hypothetical protein
LIFLTPHTECNNQSNVIFCQSYGVSTLKASKSSSESVSCNSHSGNNFDNYSGRAASLVHPGKGHSVATLLYQKKYLLSKYVIYLFYSLSLFSYRKHKGIKSHFLPEQWSEHLKTRKSSSESMSCTKTLFLARTLTSTAGGLPP